MYPGSYLTSYLYLTTSLLLVWSLLFTQAQQLVATHTHTQTHTTLHTVSFVVHLHMHTPRINRSMLVNNSILDHSVMTWCNATTKTSSQGPNSIYLYLSLSPSFTHSLTLIMHCVCFGAMVSLLSSLLPTKNAPWYAIDLMGSQFCHEKFCDIRFGLNHHTPSLPTPSPIAVCSLEIQSSSSYACSLNQSRQVIA